MLGIEHKQPLASSTTPVCTKARPCCLLCPCGVAAGLLAAQQTAAEASASDAHTNNLLFVIRTPSVALYYSLPKVRTVTGVVIRFSSDDAISRSGGA